MENAAHDAFRNASSAPGADAFAFEVDGVWHRITWESSPIRSGPWQPGWSPSGVEPGARVVVFAGTSYGWVLCDFAIWAAGAVSVPIYETASEAQVGLIVDETKAVAAFVGRPASRSVLERVARPSGSDWRGRRHHRLHLRSDGGPMGCVLTHANLTSTVDDAVSADGVQEYLLNEQRTCTTWLEYQTGSRLSVPRWCLVC